MGNKYKRVLAILWHWDPLREKRVAYDTVGVQGERESLVCRIQHVRSLKDISADMANCAKKVNADGKLIMMIHRESLGVETHQELKGNIEKALPSGAEFDWKVFGGGSDYLYYDCRRDTGLLNQEGDFVIEDSYEYFSDNGNILERLASVVVKGSEAQPVLKKNYFQQVWYCYHYGLKKKVYELERDLFLYFAPFTDPEYEKRNAILATHLEANELLALRLQSFVGVNVNPQKAVEYKTLLFDNCSGNLEEAYGQAAVDVHESLKQAITGVFLSKGPNEIPPYIAIPQVREGFIQLRSLMPERISY